MIIDKRESETISTRTTTLSRVHLHAPAFQAHHPGISVIQGRKGLDRRQIKELDVRGLRKKNTETAMDQAGRMVNAINRQLEELPAGEEGSPRPNKRGGKRLRLSGQQRTADRRVTVKTGQVLDTTQSRATSMRTPGNGDSCRHSGVLKEMRTDQMKVDISLIANHTTANMLGSKAHADTETAIRATQRKCTHGTERSDRIHPRRPSQATCTLNATIGLDRVETEFNLDAVLSALPGPGAKKVAERQRLGPS